MPLPPLPQRLRRMIRWPFAMLLAVAAGLASAQAAEPAGSLRDVPVAAEAFTRGTPLPAWVQPQVPPATTRSDVVVLRMVDTQIRLADTESVFVDMAIQVNDAAALARIGQVQLAYMPQYQQLHLHAVQILRGAEVLDRTASVGVRFLQREAGLERGVYSGAVTVALLVPDVRVGDTLRVAHRVDGSNPVFGKTFFDLRRWDSTEPVEWRRVVLHHDARRSIAWRMLGDYRRGGAEPVISESAGMRTLRFEERAIEPLAGEDHVPDGYIDTRALQFSEYRDWNQVARWAVALFPPPAAGPAELDTLVQRFAGLPDAEARTAAALQWVQTEIRNFSAAMGERSHRPQPPQAVLQQRYGDCKDKSYLLVTLLQRLGVPAVPVLMSLQSPRWPGRLLPTPAAFDHAIVQVRLGDETLHLDPTRTPQPVPLRRLARAPARSLVLPAVASAAALVPLAAADAPASGHDDGRVELVERIVLPQFAPEGTLESRVTLSGYRAEFMRTAWPHLSAEDRRQVALEPYQRRYPGAELTAEPQVDDDTAGNRFSVVGQLRLPRLAQLEGGTWTIAFFPHVLRGAFNLPSTLQRRYPLAVLDEPLAVDYTLSVQWPAQVSGLGDPITHTLKGRVFDAETRSAFRGPRFDFSLALRTTATEIAAAELPTLQDDLARLGQLVGGRIAVDPLTLASDAPTGNTRQTAQGRLKLEQQAMVDLATQAIADGQLESEDLAEAHCLRAQALTGLGRGAEGTKDSAEAVRLAPNSSGAWQCRGVVLQETGDFVASDTAFTRALVLGQAKGGVLFRRGVTRFMLGRFDDAARDFAGAVVAGDDGGVHLQARLWQAWTLQRAGRPLPADLLADARQDPRGPWPRPALAMLVGDLAPEALLAALEPLQGDERALTLTEAMFYVGQYHLLQGRRDAARAAFEQARSHGITRFVEHVIAGFELARLARP